MMVARRLHLGFVARSCCAGISWSRISEKQSKVRLRLHFSQVIGALDPDLSLTFADAIAVSWEPELPALIPLPDDLPKLGTGAFAGYTYPLLEVDGSGWAEAYNGALGLAGHAAVRHFFFVSLNDLVHVLSVGAPLVRRLPNVEVGPVLR